MKTEEVATTKRRYRQLKVPRPQSWARFSGQDDYGNPREIMARVSFWGVTEDGEIVGLVGDDDEGLSDVRSFSNFIGFRHDGRKMVQQPR